MSPHDLRTRAAVVAFPGDPPRAHHHRFAHLDLAIDLGDAVGSARWWRGLATLLLLGGIASLLARGPTPLPTPALPEAEPAQLAALEALTITPLALGGEGRAAPTPMGRAAVRLAEPPERPRITATARVAAAGGLREALRRGGVGAEEAARVAALVAKEADVSALKAGTTLDMVLGRRETKAVPRPLEELRFRAAFDLKLELARAGDGFRVKRIPVKIDRTPLRIEARVGSSFRGAAREAGIPAPIANQVAQLLQHRLDFERDIKGADRFAVVMEHQRAETGETITGGLLYVKLMRSKAEAIEILRWSAGGKAQFFLADGSSVKKGLMKTPVAGARMTSGFGLRVHPILGYSRFHRGMDFGAPMGAPIISAAAGRVVFAGRHGGHGNYVKVDHGKGLATAYAHMSRIAVRVGQSVAQGQLLGAVGSTGMSTGPHLHYEVYRNGQPIDPRSIKFMGGVQVASGEMGRFKGELGRMRELKPRGRDSEVATAEGSRERGARGSRG